MTDIPAQLRMPDKPIIFSAPMMKALLKGRKTQDRRVLKLNDQLPKFCGGRGDIDDPTCWGWEDCDHGDWVTLEKDPGQRMGWRDWRGAYRPGDRLWVREAVKRQETDQGVGYQTYAACGSKVEPLTKWYHKRTTIPSIHMPRWASRLTLTVTDVRVHRLQEISEADAAAEGVERSWTLLHDNNWRDYRFPQGVWLSDPIPSFRTLWNSLHGPDAWDSNPWVVALTFDVHPRSS